MTTWDPDTYLAERKAEDDTVQARNVHGRADKWELDHLARYTRLGMGQTYVLDMLRQHDPNRVSYGALTARRPNNVLLWRAVDKLQRAGLVQAHYYQRCDPRTDEMVRLRAFSLTAAGSELVQKANRKWHTEKLNRGWE